MLFFPFLQLSGRARWRRVFTLVVAGDKQAAQQFSDWRFRQGIDKHKASRALEIRKTGRAAELFEVLFADRPPALDERRDDLAPFLVGEGDDGHFMSGRVERKRALDLDRRDVLATGNDHVVDAAGDEQIAIAVDKTGIAGE